MKALVIVGIALFWTPLVFGDDERVWPPKGLSQHVEGLASSYDIVTKHIHPTSYLCSLKVKDTTTILDGWSRYELARTLLDVHHLCQALSHQGYSLKTDKCPILKLAQANFKGFDSCHGEGGYSTSRWAEFFESGTIRWGVDSTFENQDKAEGGAEQPATTPESKPERDNEAKSESERRSQ